jgi:prefoldin subunit 5
MDANDGKTPTPNLVAKVAELEKQNKLLQRRLSALEKSHKQLETAHAMLRSVVAQVDAKKAR